VNAGPSRARVSANVLIADSNQSFRHGLRINLGAGFSVIGEAGSVSELEELVENTESDLLLVGQDLPGGGLQAAIEAAPPTARIVVFADAAGEERVVESLQLGVSGYLLKSMPANSISPTLEAVMRGEPVIDQSLVKRLVEEITGPTSVRRLTANGELAALTPREQQVAVLLGSGSSTREIATALGVSTVTARRHISTLMRKLRVASRTAVADLING
jgi:DNA-binding NarL/FixJ family response regulator